MNFVFWFLIILALCGVWLILSSMFKLVGKLVTGIAEKTKNNIENCESEDS